MIRALILNPVGRCLLPPRLFKLFPFLFTAFPSQASLRPAVQYLSPVNIFTMHPTTPVVVTTVLAIGHASAAPISGNVEAVHTAHGQHSAESLSSNAHVDGSPSTGGCNSKTSFAETLGCLISVCYSPYPRKLDSFSISSTDMLFLCSQPLSSCLQFYFATISHDTLV